MKKTRLPNDTVVAINSATRRSIKRFGGSEATAEYLGINSRQHIERWYRDDDRSIPLSAVAAIEPEITDGAKPPILSVLADLCGFDLVRRRAETNASMVSISGDVARLTGEVVSTVIEAAADGIVSGTEADAIEDIADKAISELEKIRTQARKVRGA